MSTYASAESSRVPRTFDTSLKRAEEEFAAKQLKRWFASISPVSQADQRHGLDWRVRDALGRCFSAQCKADWKSEGTGNAFIETVSVVETNTPGWAYTCEAQLLVYWLPQAGTMYFVNMMKLKSLLPEWKKQYREVPSHTRRADGTHYETRGLLVPIDVFIECVVSAKDVEKLAERI